MTYTAINFTITPFSEDIADALIAEISELGYDGFQYNENGFTAYIPSSRYNEKALDNLKLPDILPSTYRIGKSCEQIEERDWNKEWSTTGFR